MKVKSFGCSFIFGNELGDDAHDGTQDTPSQFTWPALIAAKLGAEYQCFAQPGTGNLRILDQIIHQAELSDSETLFVVGWTWIERFDFVVDGDRDGRWRKHWDTITAADESKQARVYYKNFHSELKDKLQSLIYIRTAIDLLKQKQIPFVMTSIDDLLLDRQWHATNSVTSLQDYVEPYISDFEGRNFLAWAQHHGFPIGRLLHPLDQAHTAAADCQLQTVREVISSCRQ